MEWWVLPLAIVGVVAAVITIAVAIMRVVGWWIKRRRTQTQPTTRSVELNPPEPELASPILESPKLYIQILGYTFGRSTDAGYPPASDDRVWLKMSVGFSAPSTVLVESVKLDLSGERISCYDGESFETMLAYQQYFFFAVPQNIRAGKRTGQIVALGSGKW